MSDPLETYHLRALLALVDAGSLEGAAQACGQSRSALRRSLAELEEQIGTPLVSSSGGTLLATSTGQHLVDGARPLLAEAVKLAAEARAQAGDLGRRLRIAVPTAIPPTLMHALAIAMHDAFTEPLEYRAAGDTLRWLERGADMALIAAAAVPDGPWNALQLAPSRHGLVAAAAYIERHGSPATLQELTGHEIGVWSADGHVPHGLPLLDGGSCALMPRVVSNDGSRLWQLAAAELQISMVPDAHRDMPELPPMVRVLPDLVGSEIYIWAIVPTELSYSRRLETTIRKMRETLAQNAAPMS